MKYHYKASIGILFCIFYLCSCQSPQKQVNNPQETENGIITLTADYPIEKDTLTLSEIADTCFLCKTTTTRYQQQCTYRIS